MRLNTKLYNAIWMTNGKRMTIMSYVYLLCGVLSLTDDITTALMFAVMAELSKVDRDVRFLAVEQAGEIIKFNDEEDEKDEHK